MNTTSACLRCRFFRCLLTLSCLTTAQPSIVFMQTKPPTVSLSEIQLIGIGVSALALFCCCLVLIALIYRCGTDVDDEESGWSVDTLTKPNPMDRLTKQSSIGKTNGADADAQYNSQPQQQEEPTSAIISYRYALKTQTLAKAQHARRSLCTLWVDFCAPLSHTATHNQRPWSRPPSIPRHLPTIYRIWPCTSMLCLGVVVH